MRRKEAIIRYLGEVGRGTRHQIAESIEASLNVVSVRLTELKREGLVTNLEWVDGSKVWILTESGARRYDYYVDRAKSRRKRKGATTSTTRG